MIIILRKIRLLLATEGSLRKYSLYAVGEIILVVVGILIAFQIDNWNAENERKKVELSYLSNIKQDLNLNIKSLKEFIDARKTHIRSADILLDFFNSKKVTSLDEFNFHNFSVLIWYPFIQNANTYNELINSGNFAIISNIKIKNEIQDMQTSFGKIDFIENEMQQDYDRYLYHSYFNTVDLYSSLQNLDEQLANDNGASETKLDQSDIELLLNNKLYKNGIVLAAYNSKLLVTEYTDMIDRTNRLIDLINIELNR